MNFDSGKTACVATTSSMSGLRSATEARAPAEAEWQELLDRFPPVPLELLESRSLFLRRDTKFLVSPGLAARLVDTLAGDYGVLGIGPARLADYRTLYFDTPGFRFFHDHRRGRRLRHKVRIRHYADRDLAFLEVKTRRTELETTKARRPHAYGNLELSAEDEAFVRERTGVAEPLRPCAWTLYRRLTLVGLRANERVTVDLDYVAEMGARRQALAGVAIVELKQQPFRRASAIWSALRAAGIRPAATSKYCTALAGLHPELRLSAPPTALNALERGQP